MQAVRLTTLLLVALTATGAGASDEDVAAETRGEYLTAAAGCMACHTDSENDGEAFAGGHRLESPFGLFITPNITPDQTTGIGGWSQEQFVAAVRMGTGPEGQHYYPAFPYPAYAGMSEQDAGDIYAYLMSLEPVMRANEAHELKWFVPGRWSMRIWNALFYPWEYPDAGETSPEWERGAYLVRHLGHCGECHTPRSLFGVPDMGRELAGVPKDSLYPSAPDITRDKDSGIGNWSDDELLFFLELGMLPDGDFAGGSMTAVVDENTAMLSDADRAAIITYLRSLPRAN